jgi:hypothetical protein
MDSISGEAEDERKEAAEEERGCRRGKRLKMRDSNH